MSAIWFEKRRQDAHSRSLARAVWSEQTENGTLGHSQIESIKGADLGLSRAVAFDETFGGNRIHVLHFRETAKYQIEQTF